VSDRPDPIIERLVRDGLVDVSVPELRDRTRALSPVSLCWVHGMLDETALAGVLADHHARPAVVLERSRFPLAPFARMRRELELTDEHLLPVEVDAEAVHVVVDRPARLVDELEALGQLFGRAVVVRVALAVTLERTIRACAAALGRGEGAFVGALSRDAGLYVVEPRVLNPVVVGEITQAMVLDELMELDITAETALDDGEHLVEAFARGVSFTRTPKRRRPTTRSEVGSTADDDKPSTYTGPAQAHDLGEETSQVVLELDGSPGPHYGRGHGEKARVVVVDDDLAARALVVRELADQGYEITEVDDAHAAIAVIRQRPPDLVVSDVMLPDIGGFQLCRAIKESRKYGGIGVVLVSAVIDSERVDDGVLALYGVDAYFEKPLHDGPFHRRVRELLVERGAATSLGADAFERALSLYRDDKLDEAVAALALAIEAEPQSVRFALMQANLYYKLGRQPEAMAAYERVLRLRPDHFPALNRLGYLYHKAGLSTKAIETWGRAVPVCPDPRVREIIEGVIAKLSGALAR
jgi:DNA-binding response OmpR family regulator